MVKQSGREVRNDDNGGKIPPNAGGQLCEALSYELFDVLKRVEIT
jgi:hypothetical protein